VVAAAMFASASSSGTTRTAAPWPWPAMLLRGPEAAAINLSAYPGILFAGDSGAPNDADRIVDALKSAADQELRSQSGSPARLDKRLHLTPVVRRDADRGVRPTEAGGGPPPHHQDRRLRRLSVWALPRPQPVL